MTQFRGWKLFSERRFFIFISLHFLTSYNLSPSKQKVFLMRLNRLRQIENEKFCPNLRKNLKTVHKSCCQKKFHFQISPKNCIKLLNGCEVANEDKFMTRIESFEMKKIYSNRLSNFPSHYDQYRVRKVRKKKWTALTTKQTAEWKPQNFNFITVKLMMKFRFDLFENEIDLWFGTKKVSALFDVSIKLSRRKREKKSKFPG